MHLSVGDFKMRSRINYKKLRDDSDGCNHTSTTSWLTVMIMLKHGM